MHEMKCTMVYMCDMVDKTKSLALNPIIPT